MRDIGTIKNEIGEFSKANEILSYREVEELANILFEDEEIMNITIGGVEGNKGLVVETIERLLFVYYNEIFQVKVLAFSLDDLEYIHLKQQNLLVAMELFFSGTKIELTDLPPDDANDIKEELRSQIDYNLSNKKGKPQKKQYGILKFIVLAGIAVLSGYLAGPHFNVVTVYDQGLSEALTQQEGEKQYQLAFSDFEFDVGEYGSTVRGTITNQSDKVYRYINIDIQYYNRKGAIVESKIETALDLKPGKSWHFESMPISEYAKDFEIAGVYAEEAKTEVDG